MESTTAENRQDKLNTLRKLRSQLKRDEEFLDAYRKAIPPKEYSFAHELADRANRAAYNQLKEVIADLEKELGVKPGEEV